MPVNITPCSFWPYEPKEPPVRITADGPSNVLMVQNRYDPATPLSGARALRRALGDRARMVTVDAVGHGAYVDNGNACGDGLVTAFLLTGQRPADDARCPASPEHASPERAGPESTGPESTSCQPRPAAGSSRRPLRAARASGCRAAPCPYAACGP
ncbi:alpha/beta hydrolase [Streptomyces sp. M19]